ncbi:MAG: hypothetical protein K5644_02665 [Lachnospiraceae bacterium]|nr:hypothetical protein [Lachnospiraceae bacterium]
MIIDPKGKMHSSSVAPTPIKPEEKKDRLISMLKELVKGYYLILFVGALCILLLIIIMLFA